MPTENTTTKKDKAETLFFLDLHKARYITVSKKGHRVKSGREKVRNC